MAELFGPVDAPFSTSVRPGDSRSFGGTDRFFQNCTAPDSEDGTNIEAEFLNQLTALLRSLARANGLTGAAAHIVAENNADDDVLTKAVQHLLQRNRPKFAVDTGAADALVVTLSPAPAELVDGMEILVRPVATSLTATPTIIVNGLGAVTIVDTDGSTLQPGDIKLGQFLPLAYRSSTNKFHHQTVRRALAGAKPSHVRASRTTMAGFTNNVFVQVAGFTTTNSQLRNSTWNAAAGSLTIGTEDAGIWFFEATAIMSTEELVCTWFLNGGGGDIRNGDGFVGQTDYGRYVTNSGFMSLVAGDVVTVRVYQRNTPTNSKTLDTCDINCCRLAA